MLFKLNREWDTLLNTNFIQAVDKIDEKTILITMERGKEYKYNLKKEETIEKIMLNIMHNDQHPAITYKVEVVGLAAALRHNK